MANFDFSHVSTDKRENISPNLKLSKLCEDAIDEVNKLHEYLLELSDEDFLSERTQIEVECVHRLQVKLARLYLKL